MVGTLSFATALQATLREVGAWLVWLAHIVRSGSILHSK